VKKKTSVFIARDFDTEHGFDVESAEKGFDGESVKEVVAWRQNLAEESLTINKFFEQLY